MNEYCDGPSGEERPWRISKCQANRISLKHLQNYLHLTTFPPKQHPPISSRRCQPSNQSRAPAGACLPPTNHWSFSFPVFSNPVRFTNFARLISVLDPALGPRWTATWCANFPTQCLKLSIEIGGFPSLHAGDLFFRYSRATQSIFSLQQHKRRLGSAATL